MLKKFVLKNVHDYVLGNQDKPENRFPDWFYKLIEEDIVNKYVQCSVEDDNIPSLDIYDKEHIHRAIEGDTILYDGTNIWCETK